MRAIGGGDINWDEELWRYFRPARFLSLLDTQTLYFASANQFADNFEGAVAVQMERGSVDPRYAEERGAEEAFRELKRLTKISCWHIAAYESDAMWKLYAEENKGIAIRTTPGRLKAALKPFRLQPQYGVEEFWVGPVKYVDLTKVRMKHTGMLDRFFHKHRAFEWEREFRVAISLRIAEEFGVQVPADGVAVEVDLGILIESIVIGSQTSPEERANLNEQIERAGFGGRLQVSSLLGFPRYT